MVKHNFKKLDIWKEGKEFCYLIYDYTDTLPERERFNLIFQLRKCGVSIPSNIAEGSGKRTNAHFSEFLTTSLTSAFETETQLLVCQNRKYGKEKDLNELLKRAEILQKKIFNFREKISNTVDPS